MYPGFPHLNGSLVPRFQPPVQAPVLISQVPTDSKGKLSLPTPLELKKASEAQISKDSSEKKPVITEHQDSENSPEWPNGEERREYVLGNEPLKWKETKWAWRSSGRQAHNGRRVEQRNCLGVFSCANAVCGRLIRPKTDPSARKNQLHNGCRLCHSPIVQIACQARSYHYETSNNGVIYSVWEHSGIHSHERPPGGRLSVAEQEAVDAQVTRNPTALVHALRTGDTFPGSVPLPEISGTLANPQVARYQVGQSQARLGISPPAASKGGLAVLKSLFDLQQEFKTPFIINSSIHGPAFLTFQTPFMRTTLEKSVDSWNDQTPGNHLMARHGFVTDGDHSFFREVLYTWILRQDIAHHRPHFRHIQETVVKYLQLKGLEFEPKYLLHVFDFSAAQRSAHAAEYAEAVITMTPGFYNLTKASQENEHAAYLEQALQAERGCSFHFWQSAERITSNSALVPSAKAAEFNLHLRILEDKATSRAEFDKTIVTLNSEYPNIVNWLSWWLRPTFRSLIFPAYSSLDPSIAIQVPRTSNPAEHSHSLLHHSVGSDQDLIPGIKKLFLHVKELESQYNSIKDGHYNPGPPRAYRPPGKPKWDENDGRAPDTEAALGLALNTAPNSHDLSVDLSTINRNLLHSYNWQSPNSCFVDNGLEIWFRAYSSWSSDSRAAFLACIPSHTFLSCLFHHYERRLKQLSTEASITTITQNLSMMQTMTLDRIFNKWQLYSDKNAYGCAKTWLSHAVIDGNPSTEIQEYFGLTHHTVRECKNGHQFSVPISQAPEVWFTVNNRDMNAAHITFGDHVTTSNYFQHYIPRSRGGNYAGGTTPVHLLPVEQCLDPSCTAQSPISSVSTHWPQIFNLNADVVRVDPHKLRFENTFSIPDQNGGVTYELVGRVRHINGNHFVSQVRFGGRCHSYNDMENGGRLILSDNPHLLEEKDDLLSVCYIYNRSSSKKQTSRLAAEIIADYESEIPVVSITIPVVSITDSPSPGPVLAPMPTAPQEVLNFSTNSDLDSYPEEAYNLCDSCQLSQPNPSRPFKSLTVTCTLCERIWHEDCVSMDGADMSLDDTWACPACIHPHGGRWDKVMLGTFILLKPKPSARFYPAKVLGRSSPIQVHVEWYNDNIYQADDDPLVTISVFTPNQCLHAKYCDTFFEYTKENLGAIKWPVRLEEDAADKHDYSNTDIRKILEGSYGAVLEIMLGTRDHPIVPLYNNWIKNRSHSVKMITQHQFKFTQQFKLDVLPGDLSLIDPFLQYLHHDTKNSKVYVESHWIHNVASVLFRLAILRGYLGRQPCDDEQIFYLAYTSSIAADSDIAPDDVYYDAKKGTIDRLLTLPEIAMAASGSIHTMGVHLSLGREVDKQDLLTRTQFVEARTASGSLYAFFNTTASGMAGGPHFVRNHRIELLVHAGRIEDRERPKPRPRGKAAKDLVPKGVRVIKPAAALPSLKRSHEVKELSEGLRRSKRNKMD
ncbi:hypothetical protein BDZ97DRAFT_1958322 [Flammula alnicola]|nr:hypothetical protein BDZ97DRAFT_1958322 [Flammula alnicola]